MPRLDRLFTIKVPDNNIVNASTKELDLVVVCVHPVVEKSNIVVSIIDFEYTVNRFNMRDGKIELQLENYKNRQIPIEQNDRHRLSYDLLSPLYRRALSIVYQHNRLLLRELSL